MGSFGGKTSGLMVLFLLVATPAAVSQMTVERLPGFNGTLPFKMETGYVGVGEFDEVQLFYSFFESERDPVFDPLVLWLTGGPGCSGFSAIFFEIGPLTIRHDFPPAALPSIILDPFSWTKVASIIFIDAPVGAGFSYANIDEAYNTSDTLSASQTYIFLRKWLLNHPNFLGIPVYIGGDSYSGIVVPLVVEHILQGIQANLRPKINLQGYLLGNPLTNKHSDENSRVQFVHRTSLISDEYYHDAKLYCHGEYVNVNLNNTLCRIVLQNIKQCLSQLKLTHILEPQCAFSSPHAELLHRRPQAAAAAAASLPELRCREYGYALSYKYMNSDVVQSAIGVRKGTVGNWRRCPKTMPSYTENVHNTVHVHKNLSQTGLRALVYSGDHDISIPYVGTLQWIKSLGVPLFDEWRPWYVDGQIAGYQTKFMNDQFRLTYATVKGGGHTAPEYKPKECQAMVDRWFARYPI